MCGLILRPGELKTSCICTGAWRHLPTKTPDEQAKLKKARALASAIAGADPSGVPINHPIRWPGSWHRKGTPKLCKIVELNTEIEIEDLDDAIAVLGTATPSNNGNSRPNASFFREQGDPEKVRDALRYYPNNDLEYDEWLAIGMAIHDYLGEAGRAPFDEWSQKSSKFNEKNQDTKWRSFKPGGGITIGTLFELAKRGGWRGNGFRRGENTEARQDKTLSPDDFYCYMPLSNSYIFTPTGEMWPATSVNARVPPILVTDGPEPLKMKASAWLARHRPVEQMTWAPGLPGLIKDRVISGGGWVSRPGSDSFNLYRPPTIALGDATKAEPWIEHVKKVFPDDAAHIIYYLAQRVQTQGKRSTTRSSSVASRVLARILYSSRLSRLLPRGIGERSRRRRCWVNSTALQDPWFFASMKPATSANLIAISSMNT